MRSGACRGRLPRGEACSRGRHLPCRPRLESRAVDTAGGDFDGSAFPPLSTRRVARRAALKLREEMSFLDSWEGDGKICVNEKRQ